MFYKHWKKFALSLTAFFWASCHYEDTAQPLYGENCPSGSCIEPQMEGAELLYGVPSPSEGFDDPDLFKIPASSNTKAAASSSSEVKVPNFSSAATPSSSEAVVSSSSETRISSSSSGIVSDTLYGVPMTCQPTDSVISYYPPDYSESVAKSGAEEKANRAGVAKIDSIMEAQKTIPQSLANLRQQLSMFVALYGAPVLINPNEVCSDGITRPTQAYLDYLKMKEEWEKNKPALDEECKKIYEDKLKEIEQSIKECLKSSDPSTDLTACDLEAMCPEYGVDSKCTYKYSCNDGLSCRRTEGESDMNCTDKQGEKINYTKNEFEKKYYEKRHY